MGIHLSRLKLDSRSKKGGWLSRQLASLTALDGTRPAAVADFENWRFAIPKLGPEPVVDGDFSSGASWLATSNWSVTGGQAVAAATAAFSSISQLSFPFVAGAMYRVEIVVASVSAGSIRVSFTGGTQVNSDTRTAPGTYVQFLTANSGNNQLNIQAAASGFTGAIDSISVREVMLGESPDFDSPTLRECTFAEWFAYTSSTPAAETYTDASGVLQVNGSVDTPRQDYSSGSRRLLLENAATNLLQYSHQIDNAVWQKDLAGVASAPVVTSNAGIAPDDTASADRVQFALNGGTTSTDRSELRQTTTTTAVTHTLSFWIRSYDGSSTYQMLVRDVSGLVNEIVVTGQWQRYQISGGPYPAGVASIGIAIRGAQTPTNNDSADVLLWGVQLEASSVASSYIPTVATSVTRAINTARFSPMLEAILQRSAATVLQRGDLSWPNTTTVRTIIGQANADESLIAAMSSTTVRARTASTSITATLGSGDLGADAGIASAFNSSGRSLAANGGTVVSDATAQGSRAAVYLRRTAGGSYGDGRVKLVAIYPTRLSNASLQALAVAA